MLKLYNCITACPSRALKKKNSWQQSWAPRLDFECRLWLAASLPHSGRTEVAAAAEQASQ